MKKILFALIIGLLAGNAACKSNKSATAPCPTNGKNIGAERILSGEKLPKVKKFRS